MRRLLVFLFTLSLGFPLAAEPLAGLWKNPATGETLKSTIDVTADPSIEYCYGADKMTCSTMTNLKKYSDGTLEYRSDDVYKRADGTTLNFEHIWNFKPVAGGYDGTYYIQVEGQEREFRASARFR